VEELCYETLYAFYNSGLLSISPGRDAARPIPFDARRNGFCLAEGAAVLMLEEAESAMARGATILGKVNGYGSAFDCQPRQNAEAEVKPAATAVARADCVGRCRTGSSGHRCDKQFGQWSSVG
jgi:3-oxoacyl-(acyl-carrier-protein) synthase